YPRANVYCFIWIVIFFRIISVPAWMLLGLWFGTQLLSGLGSNASEPGVAFWAHVGGFVAGLMLVTMLRPSSTSLLQAPRSSVFTLTAPSNFARRQARDRGSVPEAGRPYYGKPRTPWD